MAKSRVTLPGPILLVKESWVIYKKSFWNIVGVGLLAILTVLGYIVLGGLGGGLMAVVFANHLNIFSYLFIGIVGVLYLLGFFAVIAWAQAAFVVVIRDWEKKTGSRLAFKNARQYAVPFVLTSLLSMVLVIGGIFLFVIPGILLSIWFSYSIYAVVCEDKKGLLALHSSREYFRGKFWKIIGREIAVRLPEIILSMFIASMVTQHVLPGSVQGLYQLLSLLAAPFYMIYSYLLYTKVRAATGSVATVPGGNKKVYFGIPLVGYAIIIIAAMYGGPMIMKLASQTPEILPAMMGKTLTNDQIKPSTAIVYGLVSYYLTNKNYPPSLDNIVDKSFLPKVPNDSKTGLPYRYTVLEAGQDFKLCTPQGEKPEKCVTSKSTNFDL